MTSILIADDEPSILRTLSMILEKNGYDTFQAPDIDQSVRILESNNIDIAFLDIRLGTESGLDLLDIVRHRYTNTSVIMISAFSLMDETMKALKLGAEAYIAKPVRMEEAIFHIKKIMEKREIIDQNKKLKRICAYTDRDYSIVGVSEKIKKILDMVYQIKDLPSPVLIEGESGTGKEVVAKAIHFLGNRKEHPFTGINCSAIPANLFESELFGYKKGSFTGAVSDFEGLFAQTGIGTFYLDDIDDIPLEFQPKLLRVLQENRYRRIGDTLEHKLESRIIASSKESLKNKVEESAFRKDLYYRLNIINIYIPPLRERREDIIPLAEYFLEKKKKYLGISDKYLDEDAKKLLLGFDYKGNVRELENIIERSLIFSKGTGISEDDIKRMASNDMDSEAGYNQNLKELLKNREAEIIRETLQKFKGSRRMAADHLSVSIRTLLYKIKEYGL